jgi:uncharacterized membrane protein
VHLFELRPNCSLTRRTATIFFLCIATVSLGIAGSFAAAGYWPILPFAGLELAALGAALAFSMRQGRMREMIRVDESNVTVRTSHGDQVHEYEFQRPWTRVQLKRPSAGNWPSRLSLKSMGRSVEVGSFLTDDEREGLRGRLTEVIGNPGAAAPVVDEGQSKENREWTR